ncbi:MAG: hypothetical protein ACR2HZ_08280 [Gemmatimonadaceae bacterium]
MGLTVAVAAAFLVSGSEALRESPEVQVRGAVSVELPKLAAAATIPDSADGPPASAERSSAEVNAAVQRPAPSARSTTRPLAPLVAPGRTEMGDGVYIERAGQTVTVHFDTPTTRTRRRDKFESVVRRTLPEVYGSAAEAILSSIPEGTLVDPAIMVTDIAERGRGVRLDSGDGWKFSLWPETRPGEDGPLVVSYRVAVTQ